MIDFSALNARIEASDGYDDEVNIALGMAFGGIRWTAEQMFPNGPAITGVSIHDISKRTFHIDFENGERFTFALPLTYYTGDTDAARYLVRQEMPNSCIEVHDFGPHPEHPAHVNASVSRWEDEYDLHAFGEGTHTVAASAIIIAMLDAMARIRDLEGKQIESGEVA